MDSSFSKSKAPLKLDKAELVVWSIELDVSKKGDADVLALRQVLLLNDKARDDHGYGRRGVSRHEGQTVSTVTSDAFSDDKRDCHKERNDQARSVGRAMDLAKPVLVIL